MKKMILPVFLVMTIVARSQELYVYTDPASNVPARSISPKISAFHIPSPSFEDRTMQRIVPEVMIGLNKDWMLRANLSFANMHTERFRWESFYLYGKYRFLSRDDIHRHFRMAAFMDASYSRNPYHFDEINLVGDKTGLQAGVIATQLWNKFALSGTLSHTQALHKSRKDAADNPYRLPYQAVNFSLSAGYLLLPGEYTDYRQTNLNLYVEFLSQQTIDPGRNFIDMAPALQLIFNSNTKLNLGYRFQLQSDMLRMSESMWHVSLERAFL